MKQEVEEGKFQVSSVYQIGYTKLSISVMQHTMIAVRCLLSLVLVLSGLPFEFIESKPPTLQFACKGVAIGWNLLQNGGETSRLNSMRQPPMKVSFILRRQFGCALSTANITSRICQLPFL